ncbi:MAG: glycosyltransferase [Alphaproteobacteria bacterium]|nr:glycosyltransferase [Alphaproteobacteria bacterium]
MTHVMHPAAEAMIARQERPAAVKRLFPLLPSFAPARDHVLICLIYLSVMVLLSLHVPRSAWDSALVRDAAKPFLASVGIIMIWRYSWMMVHFVRSLYYRFITFPVWRRYADKAAHIRAPHVYVLVTTYQIQPEVSLRAYKSIIDECVRYGAPATIVAGVTDKSDEELLRLIFDRMQPPANIKLVVMFQAGTGKRDAMAEILRAISRRTPHRDAAVIFMDGDSQLIPGTFEKSIPFFMLMPRLGALTVDFRGCITGSNLFKEWYDLRFAQRHLLMQSMSLSKKLLVLTGRFSVFRASIATHPTFIDMLQNDALEHWRFGKFRFLTGDDKSTWFWTLKNGWDMIYLPDVQVYCLEGQPADTFSEGAIKLMTRWFGNMLRNNGRAVALGPKSMGLFTWWCLVDQKISMWTSLYGLLGALFLAFTVHPAMLCGYLLWVMFTRFIYALVVMGQRRRFSAYAPLLTYFNQIIGAATKAYILFRLNKQKWTRQTITGNVGKEMAGHRFWSNYINVLALGSLVLGVAIASNSLPLPDSLILRHIFVSDSIAETAQPAAVPGILDETTLRAAIAKAENGAVIRLGEGTILLSQPLVISKSGITIEGAGTGKTILKASFSSSEQDEEKTLGVVRIVSEVDIKQQMKGNLRLTKAIAADDREIELRGKLPQFFPGDMLLLRQPNDDAFFNKLGSKEWRREFPYLRQTLVEVKQVLGSGKLLLDKPVGVDLAADSKAHLVQLVKHVALKNLTVFYDIGGAPSATEYENVKPENMVDGITISGAAHIRLNNVQVVRAGRHAVHLDTVYAPQFKNIYLQEAWNKGKQGSGYFRISRTAYGAFDNVYLRGLRHLAFQWSSHHNVIRRLDSDCDVNFHGGFAHHNEVQVKYLEPRAGHPWPKVYRTKGDAHWATPDGEGNRIIDSEGKEVTS